MFITYNNKSFMGNYLVVGGSSGIGLQVVKDLVANGHHVYATFNQHEITDIPSAQYHALNVMDETIDFSFLPAQLDGLVYCPGAISLRPFARISPADFVADYQLQVVGAVKVIQAALPMLKEAETASIVLFSTVAVQVGLNFHSLVASSKGAIEGLTKALSAELAPKIRVNCIAPSLTDTPLAASLLNSEQKIEANAQRHPLKRVGTASDIANMVEFLLTQKSSWITGQVLHVDGGMSTLK
jgi:NAD(P)-dependent dehydrogenase (short-subunit alcohol dehydrogenase family)